MQRIIGWVINAYANSLELLYLGAVVGGTGGGAVYATAVGQAVKWFPDRCGLAVGLTAAGYGAGAVLTVIPIRYVIGTYGYEAPFLWFGIVQGAVRLRFGMVHPRAAAGRVGIRARGKGRAHHSATAIQARSGGRGYPSPSPGP